jgi:hypothetical protein
MSDSMNAQIVPNRTCGECNYCCQHLLIDTPEIRVSPGTLCHNWQTGKGCTIYDTRPSVCRGYLCGWMMFGHFDDTWRPDRCGIIVTPTDGNIPEGYPPQGIEFLIVKPDLAIAKSDFIPFISRAIGAGMPVFLAVRGPAGHKSSRTFLNTHLTDAAKARDATAFHSIFGKLLNELKAGTFKPVTFNHPPPDAS